MVYTVHKGQVLFNKTIENLLYKFILLGIITGDDRDPFRIDNTI